MAERKIKIAIVTNDMLVGGVQRQLTRLLPRLDKNKFDFNLVTLFNFPEIIDLYADLPSDLPVHRLNFGSFYDLLAWFKLWKLLFGLKPDIVVSSLFFSNTIVRVLAPLVGYRVITREHNTYVNKTRWQIFADRILSKLNYKIVAVSETVANFTSDQERISADKFITICNGIDIKDVEEILSKLLSKNELRLKFGFKADDEIFINVARLTEQKNHKLLIKSFAKYFFKHPNSKLIILGDGGLRLELNNLINDLGAKENIFLLGHQENVWEFFRISDYFISTSKIEGLSNAYLEALAAGLPLVATKTAGTDELIKDGHNGFFISDQSTEAVIDALNKLNRANYDVLSRQAIESVKEFSLDESALKYNKLFEEGYKNSTGFFVVDIIKQYLRPIWSWSPIYLFRAFLFNLFQRLSGFSHEKKIFKKKLGYDLNVDSPRTFNEKVVWKKIFDRNPLLPITADKYAVRDYVVSILGEKEAADILVPLYYVTNNPADIPFDQLPNEYIIKANHDSGGYIMVENNKDLDQIKTVAKLKQLIKNPYGMFKQEWCYWPIKRKIIVEKLLRDVDGGLVQDYKLHIFHGKCKFIHTTPKINSKRTGVRSLFTPEWKQLDVGWKHPKGPNVPPPHNLNKMIEVAEKLAVNFDYVRVDFYDLQDRIYFGEITHYHESGRSPFNPSSFDLEAGSYWNIVPNYWKKPLSS